MGYAQLTFVIVSFHDVCPRSAGWLHGTQHMAPPSWALHFETCWPGRGLRERATKMTSRLDDQNNAAVLRSKNRPSSLNLNPVLSPAMQDSVNCEDFVGVCFQFCW